MMSTSGRASETQLTFVVALVAIGFLVILGGGPGQVMADVERMLEAVAATIVQVYQNVGA
jgi:hypothetical protein